MPTQPRRDSPSVDTSLRARTSLGEAQAARSDASVAIARSNDADAIELRAIAQPQLSAKEIALMWIAVNKRVESITGLLTRANAVHNRVRKELESPESLALVTEDQLHKIEKLQTFILNAQSVKALLTALAEDLGNHPSEKPGKTIAEQVGASNKWNRVVAHGEMALAMLAKNIAWYIAPLIFPATNVSFDNKEQMAVLLLLRTVVAASLAQVFEYLLRNDAQRRYKNAGGTQAILQGASMAEDQATALPILYGVNKLSGQALPPAYQIAGYALAGLGGVIQTGAMNGLFNRVCGPLISKLRGESGHGGFTPLDFAELRTGRSQAMAAGASTEAAPPEADVELGQGATSPRARNRSRLESLLNEMPDEQLDSMTTELTGTCDLLSKLQQAIFYSTDQAGAPDSPQQVNLAPAMLNVESLGQLTDEVNAIRNAAREYSAGLAADDERLARLNEALSHADEMESVVADEKSNPSRTPHFAIMAMLSAAGAVLGSVGPSIRNKWLSDLNHRAAIFGATSSVAQAFANLGQFLGKSGEGWFISWLRPIPFLFVEFLLLQLSTTFSQMADKYAGLRADAPLGGSPSAFTIRNEMEALRTIFTLSFLAFALNEEVPLHSVLGAGVSQLAGIVPTVVELRG